VTLPGLYVILDVPTAQRVGHDIQGLARILLDAGATLVQLRDKHAPMDEVRRRAESVARIIAAHGEARLLLNTHWELAVELGCGAHLTGAQLDLAHEVRASVSCEEWVGASTHDAAELARVERGADFVTMSPVFATASKPGYGPLLGLEGLEEVCRASSAPVFALAGVTPERAASCREAGALGVAVMGGIAGSSAPAKAVRAYLDALT